MKKLLCLFVVAIMLVTLAACGEQPADNGDGQNPVMNFIGEYMCDRAHALVECEGEDSALVTIEWGSSAWTLSKWVMSGKLDTDTLTVEYSDCVMSEVTYNEGGEIAEEDVQFENGTGTFTFNDDGTFLWHDDQSENEDMLFEWLPVQTDE